MNEHEQDNPLTPEKERLLAEQTIDSNHPGTLLRDINTLLDLSEREGIEAGKQDVPAMKALAGLNALLAEPLQVNMQRAQFRSYPNLQAVCLLLQTCGLLRVEGPTGKGRFVPNAPIVAAFRSLNPTEQYGSLLDAWLLRGKFGTVGIDRGWPNDFFMAFLLVWERITWRGRKFTPKERAAANPEFARDISRVSLWLMRLFGLIELEQGSAIAGKPWHPSAVRRTPFGEAMAAALSRATSLDSVRAVLLGGEFDFGLIREDKEADDQDEDGEAAEERDRRAGEKADGEPAPDSRIRGGASFDTLQPVFQPHWPAWQRSLSIPPRPFREGTFTFKVTLGEIWRRIAIPARTTLEHLSDAIRRSVKFDDDHLWSFKLKDPKLGEIEISHPDADADIENFTGNEVAVGDLPLRDGESMTYIYDFGDWWEFDVLLERVEDGDPKQKAAKVIESHGKSPRQYANEYE